MRRQDGDADVCGVRWGKGGGFQRELLGRQLCAGVSGGRTAAAAAAARGPGKEDGEEIQQGGGGVERGRGGGG